MQDMRCPRCRRDFDKCPRCMRLFLQVLRGRDVDYQTGFDKVLGYLMVRAPQADCNDPDGVIEESV